MLKISSLDEKGWKMKTLIFVAWQAKGDEFEDSWVSWRVVDTKSLVIIVYLCVWLVFFCCRLCVFDFYNSMEQCYLVGLGDGTISKLLMVIAFKYG
jgi:4-amino-4-deoxy-L-arabinose transferase-like glycosyltransferase